MFVATTQRTVVADDTGERRDCLDQRWSVFLRKCGLHCLAIPNDLASAIEIVGAAPVAGVLLTGGNDLAKYGGDAPERDEVERALVGWAGENGLPVLGVCRGMQVIQDIYGVALEPVEGHVASTQINIVEGVRQTVNSYHRWGARSSTSPLEIWAIAEDGVVKAIRNRRRKIFAMMWHPERLDPFVERDLALFRSVFDRSAEAAS